MKTLTLENAKIIAEKEFGTSEGLRRFHAKDAFTGYQMQLGRREATITAIPFPNIAIATHRGVTSLPDFVVGMPVYRAILRFAFVTPNARFHENDNPGITDFFLRLAIPKSTSISVIYWRNCNYCTFSI